MSNTMTQKERILKFVADAYDACLTDGTAEMEISIHITQNHERFELNKRGIVRRGYDE